MIIAPTVFRDEEYAEPKRVLEAHGVEVTTASMAPGECIGKLGMRATATLSVSDAFARAWDAVIFVGGAGAQVFFDDADAHRLARQQKDTEGVLAAICVAPSTLARAGLLQGVNATAFPSQEQDLRSHGAIWSGEPVTIDGRIVTGNGPESAEEFGEAIAAVLGV
jgi:protease I